MAGQTRRDVLRAGVSVATLAGLSSAASAASEAREPPAHVTVSFDETLIKQYQPQLVLEGVEPAPLGFYGLHAESSESALNAVYGFVEYPYQDGNIGRSDSHLGDHEPVIVFYDSASGDVSRVDYSPYHWFHTYAGREAFQYADADKKRPMLRVDPTYHHYYVYSGNAAGERLEVNNLVEAIDGWLNNGLDENLALSQPFDPWAMFGRESWWRHNTENWINAYLKALWFNLGLSDASKTSDVSEVSAW